MVGIQLLAGALAAEDARAGDESWRDGNDVGLSEQLAAPPVRSKKSNVLGLAVDGLSRNTRPTPDVLVENSWNMLGPNLAI